MSLAATPAKLKDGSWGARVTGRARPGDLVTVTTQAGKSWPAKVEKVLWTGDGVSLCSTSRVDGETRAPSPERAPVRTVREEAPPKRRAPSTKRSAAFPTEPPEPGAHRISGRRDGREDRRFAVGSTFRGSDKINVSGGGPDGRYYTVLAARMCAPNEDNDDFDWMEVAWVRAATDAEVAPVAARLGRGDELASVAKALHALKGERARGVQMPAGAVQIVPVKTGSLAASGERVAVDVDGSLLYEQCGDPDMADGWYRYVVRITAPDPALVARIRALEKP